MMRVKAVAYFVFLLFLLFASGGSAQILLNEILADPATDWNGDGTVSSRADEWVEIINVGTSAVDLSNLRLGDTSGGMTWRYAFSGTLVPDGVLVVYGSEALAWQDSTSYPAYGLSLNNGGDTVYLYKIGQVDTLVVDQYTYAAFEVADDRSVGRRPDGTGSWVIFDGLNPYGGTTPPLGTGCNPSPGGPISCATAASEASWGLLKSKYSE